MILLVLLAPAAALGLLWAMQGIETWMNRTTRTPGSAVAPLGTGAARGPFAWATTMTAATWVWLTAVNRPREPRPVVRCGTATSPGRGPARTERSVPGRVNGFRPTLTPDSNPQ